MNIRQIRAAREMYGIESWGAGYFSIGDTGFVLANPTRNQGQSVQLNEAVEKCLEEGLSLPLILRFPQIVDKQIESVHKAFAHAIKENHYNAKHFGVFPFKVNQRREFIDTITSIGKKFSYGLEVGSKTEFMAALSYDLGPNALMICNGFKDIEYVELCFVAKAMGKNIVVVLEGPDELEMFIKIRDKSQHLADFCPQIGLRMRLYSRGSGKWAKSSGEGSKFGLSTNETIFCLNRLKEVKLDHLVTMLHFHNGSQITEIRKVKAAMKEAARVYCKIVKMGYKPVYLNIGGGIGVDYDGSKSSCPSSVNYNIREFASDCVYTILEVCKDEVVDPPNIVTESGRVIAAYHSVVVTNIREVQSPVEDFVDLELPQDSEIPGAIKELLYIDKNITQKNYNEYYHDAVAFQDELFTLFNLGYVDLRQRAYGEKMFYKICQRAINFSLKEKHQAEEFELLQKGMVTKYLANFSMFQSIPDAWSIDQLFPVMPLSRHDESPSHKATIIDITCDSDGCLDRFIDSREIKDTLDLHSPDGKPYYIGFFLVGAYQESLSNEHNLFGAIHEVEVFMKSDGSWVIDKVTQGDPIDELLESRNYEKSEIFGAYQYQVKSSKSLQGRADLQTLVMNKLKKSFGSYPYLFDDDYFTE